MKKFLIALTMALVLALSCAVIASADGLELPEGATTTLDKLAEITKIGGHAVEGPSYQIEMPTCQKIGKAYFYCAEEGAIALHNSYEGVKPNHYVQIAKLDHKYTVHVPEFDTPATCLESGKKAMRCETCDAVSFVNVPALGHVYTTKIKVDVAAGCKGGEYGYGRLLCDRCNTPEVAKGPASRTEAETETTYVDTTLTEAQKKAGIIGKNAAKYWIKLDLADHRWSDWSVNKESTCGTEGEATRTCFRCNGIETLNKDTLAKYKEALEAKEETDAEIVSHIEKKNIEFGWLKKALEQDVPNITVDGKIPVEDFEELVEELQAKVEASPKYGKRAEFDKVEDRVVNCYTKHIKYVCKYCKGTVHPAIEYDLRNVHHDLSKTPQEADKLNAGEETVYTVAQFAEKVLNTTTPPTATEIENKIKAIAEKRIEDATLAKLPKSLEATCEIPGFNIFVCENVDATHFDPEGDKDVFMDYKLVSAKGHKFMDWYTVRTYTNPDGTTSEVRAHECEVCGLIEHETIKKVDPEDAGKIVFNGTAWVKDGEVETSMNGLVDFDGEKFLATEGYLNKYTGVSVMPDGEWYFFTNGQFRKDVTTLVQYDGHWFYVKDGKLDTKLIGFVEYDGAKFLVSAGEVCNNVYGLWHYDPRFGGDDAWYFLAGGELKNYTGVTIYDGYYFYINNGKLDTTFNGNAEYNGGTIEGFVNGAKKI